MRIEMTKVIYKGDKNNPKKGDRRIFDYGTHLYTQAYDPEKGWMDNKEYNWLHRWDHLENNRGN